MKKGENGQRKGMDFGREEITRRSSLSPGVED